MKDYGEENFKSDFYSKVEAPLKRLKLPIGDNYTSDEFWYKETYESLNLNFSNFVPDDLKNKIQNHFQFSLGIEDQKNFWITGYEIVLEMFIYRSTMGKSEKRIREKLITEYSSK